MKLKGLKDGISKTVKDRRERMEQGYSDSDLWNFDIYLAKMLADALPRIPSMDENFNKKVEFIAEQMDKYRRKSPTSFYDDEEMADFHKAFKYLGEIYMGMWF